MKVVRLLNAGKSGKLKKFAVVFSVVEDRLKDLQKVVKSPVRLVE